MLADVEGLMLFNGYTGFAIGTHHRLGAVVLVDDDANFALSADDNRATGQGMWMHRHQTNCIKARVHDWTPSRQRICRGSRWCSDNQAIAMLTIHVQSVDGQLKINHMHRFSCV